MLGITTALTSELPPIPLLSALLPLTVLSTQLYFCVRGKAVCVSKNFAGILALTSGSHRVPDSFKDCDVADAGHSLLPHHIVFSCMVCHGELAKKSSSADSFDALLPLRFTRRSARGDCSTPLWPLLFSTRLPSFPSALFLVALAAAWMVSGSHKQPVNMRDVIFAAALGSAVAIIGLWSQTTTFRHAFG